MSNPFESEHEQFCVLTNNEGQHSLWPVTIEVPDGWSIVLEHSTRQQCLDYVDEHWTDMRPKSLIKRIVSATEMPLSEPR